MRPTLGESQRYMGPETYFDIRYAKVKWQSGPHFDWKCSVGLCGLALSMIGFAFSTQYWAMILSRCAQGALNGNIGKPLFVLYNNNTRLLLTSYGA